MKKHNASPVTPSSIKKWN